MNILAIYYGDFSEIEKLYSRFSRGKKKIKVVVDVDDELSDPRGTFLGLFQHAVRYLPTLSRHSCCEEWQAAPLYVSEEEGVSIKRVGEVADFPHLLEHLIVDLQCTLGNMKSCSGITCGWKNPENRFDLFIECNDPRLGVFATCFGINLINSYLNGGNGENDLELMLKLARLVEDYPETHDAIRQLADCLSESVDNITRALEQLSECHFFSDPTEQRDEERGC
jgi:hypothetical protein